MDFSDSYSVLFVAAVATYLLGALLPIALREGRRIADTFAISAIASALTLAFAVYVIYSGLVLHVSSPVSPPVEALGLSFYVNGISAFFMVIVGLASFAISIYSIGYARSYSGSHSIRTLAVFFNLFVVSMLLVTAADDVFSFLVFWELMSLASFFLVIYEHEKPENLKAGLTYLVMTHLGTAFIIAAFLVLYFQTGSLSFDAFRSAASSLSLETKGAVFLLALVGFGTKAGLVPMHTWLPRAHPVAPSNVSALMSGVMLKVAVYGMVMLTLGFIAPSSPEEAWLGLAMLTMGAISAVVGVLYAAVSDDLKRALAYSSVENVGLVFVGLGLSVVFSSYGLTALASLALLASMLHCLNHAVFKSLLFMSAGSVVSSTGTADLNRMGGLAKRMPWTSLFFLVGSLAIAGLPPLNGFVSEWLSLQALLSSYQVPDVALQLSIGFASIAFALTLGLALATSVKLFGSAFLARSRSPEAQGASDPPRTMLAGMGAAVVACVVLGIFPVLAASTIASSFGFDLGSVASFSPLSPLMVGYPSEGLTSVSHLSMPVVVVASASVAAGLFGFVGLIGGKSAVRPYSTWDGGFGALGARAEYSPTSLSQPIRMAFRWFYRPNVTVKRASRSVVVTTTTAEVFEEYLYSPIVRGSVYLLEKVRRLQTGKVNAYLLYILLVTAVLLLVAALGP